MWCRKELLHCESASHLAVLTRTAHPGLILAGRTARLVVHALQMGPRAHSLAHGKRLLEGILRGRFLKQARSEVGGGSRQVQSKELQCIPVAAEAEEQTLEVREVQVDGSWRSGLNRVPQDLQRKMLTLLQAELDAHQMAIMPVGGDQGLCLHTMRALREGDVVCPVSSLVFDDMAKLWGFLSQDGNRTLGDMLINISNVRDGGKEGSLFAVPVGTVRYVKHYIGVRKGGPNTYIRVDTSKGVNDHLLSLVVKTRNGQGIGAKSPLAINFGPSYDFSRRNSFDDGEAPKQFRGALDAYVRKHATETTTAEPQRQDGGAAPETKEGATPPCKGGGVTPPAPGGGVTPEAGGAVISAETTSGSTDAAPDTSTSASGGAKRSADDEPLVKPAVQEAVAPPAGKRPKLADQGPFVELATGVAPANCAVLLREKSPVSLWLRGSETGRKKLPPRTPLVVVRDAKVEKSKDGVAYQLTKAKTPVFLVGQKKDLTYLTLEKAIATTKACGLAKHGTFVEGASPAKFTPPEGLSLVPRVAAEMEALRVAPSVGSLDVVWALKFDATEKQLTPYAAVLVTAKQLIVPAAPDVVQLA